MKYSDKYGYFASLLLHFLILGEEEEPYYNDQEIIKAYVYGTDILERQPHCEMLAWPDKEKQKLMIQRAITQAKEVLKLDPFPEDWIWDIAGGHARPWPDENIESCKEWVEWIVKELEIEYPIYATITNQNEKKNNDIDKCSL